MRGPHRSTALMNKRKPIVYFQKERGKKKKEKQRNKKKRGEEVTPKILNPHQRVTITPGEQV